MSPPRTQTPQKPPRRSRRPPRKSTNSTSSNNHLSEEVDASAETDSNKQPIQPMHILRRGESGAMFNIAPATDSDTHSPHTPPRPRSMYEGSTSNQKSFNCATPITNHESRKPPKPRGHRQSSTASPTPSINGTPISAPRRGSAAPTDINGTPVKAYAGPTFHASPAASSLPMPKFFSKSVPNVDKTKSLKTMLEQENHEPSSGSEGSPSLENAQPNPGPPFKEDSPLDIFFRADREAKSRNASTPNMSIDGNSQAPHMKSLGRPKYHGHNSSAGNIFPLEMDGASPEDASGSATPLNSTRTSNQPLPIKQVSPESTQVNLEEQCRAQAVALKKLLFSPRPQIAPDASAGQRPPSSKLRKEILAPRSPTESISTPELPATPTPSRMQKNDANLPYGHKSPLNGYNSPSFSTAPLSTPKKGNDSVYHDERSTTRSIENDLRRILKLDVPGGDALTGH